MTPDSPCRNVVIETDKPCGHALKWHNPCSKCACQAFMPSVNALATRGSAGALPTGSAVRSLIDSGRVREDGLIVPKGGTE